MPRDHVTTLPKSARLDKLEFVMLVAMLFATVAFSIDAMLPAFSEIAAELSPDAPNLVQLIITSFILGMGAGTLIVGPLSDSYGRRCIIIVGAVLYCAGALMAWFADTLAGLLIARIIQGFGASASRVVSMALVRDLYKGREMAQIVSHGIMVFTLVPAIAPAIGQGIMSMLGWKSIFLAFLAFSLITISWLVIRQAETLPLEKRLPFVPRQLLSNLNEIWSYKIVRLAVFAQSFGFATLYATLSSIQLTFDQTFGRAEQFPYWFAVIALVAGSGGMLNVFLLPVFGMRRIVLLSFGFQAAFSATLAATYWINLWPQGYEFYIYFFWMVSIFHMTTMTMGNLNALALEPVGHVAGMASSLIGSFSTILSVMLAFPVGLLFDGTPFPLMIAACFYCAVSVLTVRKM